MCAASVAVWHSWHSPGMPTRAFRAGPSCREPILHAAMLLLIHDMMILIKACLAIEIAPPATELLELLHIQLHRALQQLELLNQLRPSQALSSARC